MQYARSSFSPKELTRLKSAFSHLDFDGDQRISRSDLVKAMAAMGYEANDQTAESILSEVDVQRAGSIDFETFLDLVSTTWWWRAIADVHEAAGWKELHLDTAFTHLAKLDQGDDKTSRSRIPVERSGGGA